MKQIIIFMLFFIFSLTASAQGENEDPTFSTSANLKITSTSVVFDDRLDQLIFTIETEGSAGKSIPTPFGQMDGRL